MAKVKSTDEVKLRALSARDQHGRVWDVMIDPASFAPCTLPIPRFQAPLAVPAHVLRFSADDPTRCTIDYGEWHQGWAVANAEWERTLQQEARRLYGTMAAEAIRELRPELIDAAGEPPQSIEFVVAARAGNRWVLGLPSPTTGAPYPAPAWAQPILDRIAPRWMQAQYRIALPDLDVDAGKYADEDGAAPAVDAETPVAGVEAGTFADEDDRPDEGLLIGADADDPDGLQELAAGGAQAPRSTPRRGAAR